MVKPLRQMHMKMYESEVEYSTLRRQNSDYEVTRTAKMLFAVVCSDRCMQIYEADKILGLVDEALG